MAYQPERWHDLFVMLGGAAGALAGLVFVGRPQPQGLRALGIELIVGGIVVGILCAETPARFWGQMADEMRVRMAGCRSSSQRGSSVSQ